LRGMSCPGPPCLFLLPGLHEVSSFPLPGPFSVMFLLGHGPKSNAAISGWCLYLVFQGKFISCAWAVSQHQPPLLGAPPVLAPTPPLPPALHIPAPPWSPSAWPRAGIQWYKSEYLLRDLKTLVPLCIFLHRIVPESKNRFLAQVGQQFFKFNFLELNTLGHGFSLN
jgi:hypothetical protein